MIDSTLLKQTTSIEDALSLIEDASGYGFKCVMLPAPLVLRVKDAAESLGVSLCTVVGFPSGFQPAEAKIAELRSVSSYVDEVDVVAPLWAAASGSFEYIIDELSEIVETAREEGVKTVKVIVEAPLFKDNDLQLLIDAVKRAGADYAKTSTGVYTKGGDPITVMRVAEYAKPLGLKVKAAGGIRTGLDALLAIAAGADRIGTSSARSVLLSYAELVGEQI